MNLVRSLETGNAWAVGRFDALMSHAACRRTSRTSIPAITWFSVSGHINGGIRGVIRAETRDDEAANNLRDVVRGFLALGKLQAGSRPEIQLMLQSLELGGTGQDRGALVHGARRGVRRDCIVQARETAPAVT